MPLTPERLSRRAHVTGSASAVAIIGALLASTGLSTNLAAQTTVDLRTPGTFARKIELSERCTVIGDGSNRRPTGLVGVSTAVRSHDGGVVVMNIGTNELLRFTAAGQFDRVLMGRGTGPGDLSTMRNAYSSAIRVAAYRSDSLLVYDDGARRISVLAPSGAVARSVDVPAAVSTASQQLFLVGALPEIGDVVLYSPAPPMSRPDASGIARPRRAISIIRLSAEGAILWFGRDIEDAATEVAMMGAPSGGRAGAASIAPNSPGVFRAQTVVSTASFVYHYAEGANELRAFGRDGTLAHRAQLPPLTDADSFVGPSARESLSMFADAAGRVWLEVSRRASPRMREWWVFSSTLAPVGTALIPNRSELMYVSESSVLLRAIDENLKQTIRVCPAPRVR